MSDGLSVKITADVTDVTAKMAVLKSEWQAQTSSLRAAASAYRDAGADMKSSALAALDAAALKASLAKTEMDALTGSMRKTATQSLETGSGLNRMRFELEGLTNPIRGVRSTLGALGDLFAVGFGADRLVAAVEKTAALGENLVKLSQQTGISVETLSDWRYAAQQVGVEGDALDRSLPQLGRHIGEALSSPTSTAAKAFQALGISQEELKTHSNDLRWVVLKMADAFHDHADGANADAIAMGVTGRAGAELIPFYRLGSDGINKLADANRALGGELTGEMADAMAKHRQDIKSMDDAWQGLWFTITSRIAPSISLLAKELTGLFSGSSIGELARLQNGLAEAQARLKSFQDHPTGIGFIDRNQVAEAKREVAELQAQIDKLKADSAATVAAPPPKPPAPAKPEFPPLASTTGTGDKVTELEAFRTKLAQMEGDWKSSHEAMLAEAVKMWQGEVAKLSEAAAAAKKSGGAEAAAFKQAAREQNEAERGLAEAKKALHAAEASDAQKTARQEAEAAKQAAREKIEAAKDSAETQIKLGKMVLATARQDLDADFTAHKVTAAQKAATLQQFAQVEYQLDLKSVQAEFAASDQKLAAYTHFIDQKKILAEQLQLQLAQIGKQEVEDQKNTATAAAREWKEAFQPVASFMRSAFDTMLQGGKDWRLKMEQEFGRLVSSFAGDVAEMMLKWAAMKAAQAMNWPQIGAALNPFGANASGLGKLVGGALGLGGSSSGGSDIAMTANTQALLALTAKLSLQAGGSASGLLSSGGVPMSEFGDGSGMGGGGSGSAISQLDTTMQSNTSAVTQNTGGILNWIVQEATSLGQSIAQFLGLTTATTVNTVATLSNTVAESAQSASSGGLIGGFVSLLGLDVGSEMISRDGLAIVHSGEMVVPATSAGVFRMPSFAQPSFGGASAFAGAAGAGGDVHIHMPGMQIVSRRPGDIRNELEPMMNWLGTRIGQQLRNNPTQRGNY